jgi:hypothetical protein
MAYDNNNTGMLAKNERMREGKKDPEYTGFVTVDGQEYWLKAWVREGKEGSRMEGKKFFSLALDPKDAPAPAPRERPARAAAPARPARQPAPQQHDDMDDDIPF